MNHVPYDESLLDSNEFMKSYWERSTDNRNVAFVQDLRTEEVTSDDFSDLRKRSRGAFHEFDSEDATDLVNSDRKVDSKVDAEDDGEVIKAEFGNDTKGPNVMQPKEVTVSTTAIMAWIFAGLAVLLAVLLYMSYRKRHMRL